MEDLVSKTPRTIMEVFRMLPEGTLAEIIEGSLIMSPSPTSSHQEIVVALTSRLFTFLETHKIGKVYVGPLDVYLDETSNVVEPDIIFVLNKNLSIIKEDAIHGVPDLLIEVLSPGNKSHDLVKKKELYKKFGVNEYWIIDPQTRKAVGFKLHDRHYVEFCVSEGQIESQLLRTTITF